MIDDLINKIVRRAEVEFEEFLDDVVEEFRDQLNTPGPSRSKPGEYPHKQTGNLQDSTIPTTPEVSDDVISGKVQNAAFYATYLKNGTSIMAPRKMFGLDPQEAATALAARLKTAIGDGTT